tara:strand:+ start:2345 stop:2959 length:615 start_codon:yes stop_codon:yes gene_type:complete
MSFNRLRYDNCSYRDFLQNSVRAGNYYFTTPAISCEPCYPYPPSIRLQKKGNSLVKGASLDEVESELRGITRRHTDCLDSYYIPKEGKIQIGNKYIDDTMIDFKDCTQSQENTRLSNPACTLRGTGVNRWVPLCLDPQKKLLIPFDTNISNRLVMKDTFRPCLPNPMSQTDALPNPNAELVYVPTQETVNMMGDIQTTSVFVNP